MKRRFRKRRGQRNRSSSAFSEALSSVNLHVGGGDTSNALQGLEQLLNQPIDAHQKAKILALAADCRFHERDIKQAGDIYQRALEFALDEQDSRFWLRPSIGRLIALVTQGRIDTAHSFAEEILSTTNNINAEYYELLDTPPNQLAADGIVIPPRPHRLSVVLTRIGRVFETRGYAADSKVYYERALKISPKGASRARQALANIALATGDNKSAARLAFESLHLGKFRVKTIASWEILVKARFRAGEGLLLPPRLIEDFFNTTIPESVRGRAVLAIARALRDSNHSDWYSIVRTWRTNVDVVDPIIRVELLKLRLADANFHRAPAEERKQLAVRLLSVQKTSVSEYIAGARAWLAAVLDAEPNSSPKLLKLFQQAEKRYPARVSYRLRHSLARTALEKNNEPLARELLFENTQGSVRDPFCQRSIWCLARLDQAEGHHGVAAQSYFRIAGEPAINHVFRIQALLLGIDQLRHTDPPEETVSALSSQLESILAEVSDASTLLDAARQLTLAGSAFSKLAKDIIARASSAALTEISEASNSSAATSMLCHLARRQYYEFNQQPAVVKFWDELPDAKREWLWNHADSWWEYLSIVFLALHTVGRGAEADGLADLRIESAATPPNGIAWLGATRLHWLARSGGFQECVKIARIVVVNAASHRQTAYAHYWLSLADFVQGNLAEACEHAVAVRNLVRSGGTARLRGLAIRAALILERLEHPVPLDSNLPRTPEQRRISSLMLDRDLRIAGLDPQ